VGNRLSFGAEGTHEAEILQSPSTKDKAKAAGGYNTTWKVRSSPLLARLAWKRLQIGTDMLQPKFHYANFHQNFPAGKRKSRTKTISTSRDVCKKARDKS